MPGEQWVSYNFIHIMEKNLIFLYEQTDNYETYTSPHEGVPRWCHVPKKYDQPNNDG